MVTIGVLDTADLDHQGLEAEVTGDEVEVGHTRITATTVPPTTLFPARNRVHHKRLAGGGIIRRHHTIVDPMIITVG